MKSRIEVALSITLSRGRRELAVEAVDQRQFAGKRLRIETGMRRQEGGHPFAGDAGADLVQGGGAAEWGADVAVGRGQGAVVSGKGHGFFLNLVFFAVGLCLAWLAPFIAKLLQLAVSRSREYLADASAVKFCRNPLALVEALKKISLDPEPLLADNRGRSKQDWLDMMASDTWLTGQAAVDEGLADGLIASSASPSNRFPAQRLRRYFAAQVSVEGGQCAFDSWVVKASSG